ncbi:MAG TPA: hypothetical protein VLF66_11275 [Thermoanaerobaculia bacterium]|nr:hypothetical protein [Thermoanaerobaculia bacterium]
MKRGLWEAVAVVLFLLILIGVWAFSQMRTERAVGRQEMAHQEEIEELRSRYDEWTDALAASQGEAVTRSFATGIRMAILAGREESLQDAKNLLIQTPHVAFVHVFKTDGAVLASSDDRYSVAGELDERAAWALAATELRTRPSDVSGITEYALPVTGGSGNGTVLWLGYETRQLKEATPPGG